MSRRVPAAIACAAALIASALALTASSSGSGTPGASSASGSGPASNPGPASSTGSTASSPGVMAAVLGDLRSLDPCSLVDPTEFGAAAAATFGDPQSLDYCVLEVQSPAGPVEVHLGEVVAIPVGSTPSVVAGSPATRGTVLLPGGVRLAEGGPGSTGCQDEIGFGDSLALIALAEPTDGPATTATCSIADTAARAAARALAAGHVGHRTYPVHSFGLVDACAILTAATVKATLAKLAGAQPIPHPAGHQCEYGASGTTSTYAALILAAAYSRFDGGPTSTTLKVAGHQVVLVPEQPDGRSGECVGYGPHIATPSRSGQPAMEMAELHVALPDGSTDQAACADVRAMAGTVFARLP